MSQIYPLKNFIYAGFKKAMAFLIFLNLMSFAALAQPGKDGAITITTANTVVNRYTRVTADVLAGSNTVTVSNIADLNRDAIGYLPGGYVTNNSVYTSNAIGLGDLIILYQAQGAVINSTNTSDYGQVTNYNGSGTYELAYVESVSGNTITLSCKAKLSYFAARYAQVIRIPQYTTLTVNAAASVVAIPWGAPSFGGADPSALERRRGGFVTALATNIVNNGSINANAAGFRGGTIENTSSTSGAAFYTNFNTPSAAISAEKGESIAGYRDDYDLLYGGRYGRGAAANGGGGGNAHNAGGGGGANGGNPANWFRGAGVMNDFGGTCGTPGAWALDPNYIANGNALTNSTGGGSGGYSFANSNLDACATGPSYPIGFISTGVPAADVSNSTWGGDYRDAIGGLGGRPVVSASMQNQVFFGGGGGAGDGNNNANADGGDGGGIVFLITSNNITGNGTIQANGENGSNTVSGHNDAPGGGGGGGTVLIQANTIATTINLNSNGGNGGNQLITGNESEGPGGGGGGGVISVNATTDGSVKTIAGGQNGRTSSASVTEFLANGATSGSAGSTATIAVNLNFVVCNADLQITKIASNAKPSIGTNVTFTITALNNGPADATNVSVSDALPAGYSFVSATPTVGSWTSPTWTIGNLANGASATLTVVATVNSTGSYANTATITSIDNPDPTPANNTATSTPVPNNPPVAVNDVANTASNTNVTINVVGNDTDTDGTLVLTSIDLDPATAGQQTTFTVAGEGTYTANAGGTVTFDPLPTFNGVATPVNYTITDNDGGVSNTATITVTVANNPPVAVNDVANTASNTNVTVNVAGNDTDTDGTLVLTSIDLDPATAGQQTTFTVAGEGTYTANAGGTVTFDPLPTFNGVATPVNYTIRDNDGGVSNTATITVTVANNPPVAVNDVANTASNTNVTINVAGNDTDTDGTLVLTSIDLDPATAGQQTTFTVAGEGTYTANAGGTVTFDPLPTFNGVATPVNYTITDNDGGVSNTATITVTVAPPITYSIGGAVLNDGNGLADNQINGPGTNAGGLNAILVDIVTGNVAAVATVQADGTYSFAGIVAGNYSLLITTASATVGNPAPAVILPAGWVSTGEHLGTGTGSDGAINGILALGTISGNISNALFGIEQPPISNDVTLAGQTNPTGTGTIVVPTLTGTDAEQGAFNGVGNGDTIVIKTVPANGILYYNGVAVAASDTIKNYNPALLTLDPNDGLIIVTFTFSEIDAAGNASAVPGVVTIIFSNSLPVNLISFTATATGTSARLNWSTSQEVNSSYFEIERSSDGISYTTIGKVKASGNSSLRLDYNFTDNATLAGSNFYRLKQVDVDGKIQYSQVRLIKFDQSEFVVVYPNPSVNEAKIKFSGNNWINKPALINVLTIDGKLAAQKRIGRLNQVETIDVTKFATGSYIIQIVTGSEVISKPIQIRHQ